MDFLAVLGVTSVLCFVLRNPLRSYPVAFYVLAITVDVAFLAGMAGALPRSLWMVLLVPLQKCFVPLSLFVVVMYIGVLPRASRASLWLRPVRAELSILACLLVAGHMAVYLSSYVPRLAKTLGAQGGMASLGANVALSLGVAMVLLVLVLVLGVTSFSWVKQHMRASTWKRVQQLSYVFFALVFAHLVMMLGPAAVNGRASAIQSVAVYATVFGLYAVLRVVRALANRQSAATAETEPSAGDCRPVVASVKCAAPAAPEDLSAGEAV